MAVQLLEECLLKEQAKCSGEIPRIELGICYEPDIIFIGDSIVEYYPFAETITDE